jgi:hypothetical protein
MWWDNPGKVWKTFPDPKYGDANPKVAGGKKYQPPSERGEAHWHVLDDNPGTETIHFAGSREPNKKLEDLYAELETLAAEVRSGRRGREPAGRIASEVNLMGPAEESMPRTVLAVKSTVDRDALFDRLGDRIRVSGADAVFKVRSRHE